MFDMYTPWNDIHCLSGIDRTLTYTISLVTANLAYLDASAYYTFSIQAMVITTLPVTVVLGDGDGDIQEPCEFVIET